MANFWDTMGGAFSGIGTGMVWVIWAIVIIIVLLIVGLVLFYFVWNRKRWNLKVEIKLIRSDGKFIGSESGKGFFDANKGVVFIKRPKSWRKIPVKVFDVKKYLQGYDTITVLQLSSLEYRPVQIHSWVQNLIGYENRDGKKIPVYDSILNIKVDNGEDKAWIASWNSASKKAFSIQSFISQFQTPIAVGIVVICCFVGFAILWSRIGK